MKELIILPVEGPILSRTVSEKQWYSEVSSLVGGLIQQVPYFSRLDGRVVTVWVNEEGMPLRLPINTNLFPYLTAYRHNWRFPAPLLGSVVISRKVK